jgi:parvulin-like peptidyl-prolyl isomerase
MGSLGFISEEDPFDPTFLAATFELNEGEISQPIETVFGYHLIAVFEKREAGMLELETVYEQINQTLLMEQQTTLYNDYIADLRENAEIIYFLDEETQE